MNYINAENTTIILTVEELKTFARDFANADKKQKVAIVCGKNNLGGDYISIKQVKD